MPSDDSFRKLAKRLAIRSQCIVNVRPVTSVDIGEQVQETYWRKKANVSLDTCSPDPVAPALPLTKCGVAASFPPVSNSSASPVWKAVSSASSGARRD
jgi:hypothetical protein